MPLDRISEEIAHFIGLFHLEIEGHRLRLEYEAFSFERDNATRDPEQLPDLVVAAPYSLKGFEPGLVYLPPAPVMPPPFLVPSEVPPGKFALVPAEPRPPAPEQDDPFPWIGWQFSWPPFVPLPNSILISIRQTSELWDNDLLLVTGETTFINPDVLIAEFLQLIDLARGFSALGPDGATLTTVPRAEAALELASRISSFVQSDGAAEVQLLLRGEAAQGKYVNGEELERTAPETSLPEAGDDDHAADRLGLPDFLDLLPAYLAEKRDAREAEDDDAKDALAIPPDGTTEAPDNKFAVDPGHTVVTGANYSSNETTIVQVWVDAPVIAVAGDAIRLDLVSQVNVMLGGVTSFGGTALPSQALNAVSMEFESAFGPDGPPPPAAPGLFPETWTVVSVAADVVAVNWVKQYIFATDFDRAEITITAAATYIGTGENVLGNGVRLAELGFHYDLILVGGSFITLNVVDQINVLLDVDTVAGSPASPVIHHSGDNLQYNLAELKQTGRDEMTELQGSFRTALEEMAEDTKTLSREVAQNARFEGKSALKVLHIEGDLIKANIIEQHNFLGDSDQVELMLDEFVARGEIVQLVTGSNAQLNAARIHDIGLDSEVMVGGEAYSDALIYQARLIDPDAAPTGVGLVPLANEAVAFLADDMLAKAPEYEPGQVTTVADHPASSDVLHAIIT